MTDLLGVRIDHRYQILKVLGEGASAVVYQAKDERLNRLVAVKIIHPEYLTANGKIQERFKREAESLARLNHPNIVGVYDSGEFDGSPYLVMEYLAGGSLKSILGRPHPYKEAARWLAPVARALEYAHSLGMIHRDVKPGNILLTSPEHPSIPQVAKLSDFGIVKILSQDGLTLTETGTALGTPEYAAPEQWDTQTGITPRIDIYALGVILYEMLTGRRPYESGSAQALMYQHSSVPFPDPRQTTSGVPERMAEIVLTATRKKPQERFQTIAEMAAALEEFLSSGPASTAALSSQVSLEKLYITCSRKMFTFQYGPPGANIGSRKPHSQPVDVDKEDWYQAIEQAVLNTGTQPGLKDIGAIIFHRIFPKEVKEYLRGLRPGVYLTLVLDEEAAKIPWELAFDDEAGQPMFLSEKFAISRQFFDSYQGTPPVPPLPLSEQEVLLVGTGKNQTGSALDAVFQKLSACEIRVQTLFQAQASSIAVQTALRKGFSGIHFSGPVGWVRTTARQAGRPRGMEYALGLANGQLLPESALKSILKGRPFVFLDVNEVADPAGPAGSGGKDEWWKIVEGLANTLISAGASAVVGVRWEVADAGARCFVDLFYDGVLQGMTTGEALRQARLNCTANSGADHSAWAAFVLYGDPRGCLIDGKQAAQIPISQPTLVLPSEPDEEPFEEERPQPVPADGPAKAPGDGPAKAPGDGPIAQKTQLLPPTDEQFETAGLFVNDLLNPDRFEPGLFKSLAIGAETESSLFGWPDIRSPSLFLALAGVDYGALPAVLKRVGYDPGLFCQQFRAIFQPDVEAAVSRPASNLPRSAFSEHAVSLLEAADQLARDRGAAHSEGAARIEDAHLLEVILYEKDSVIAQVLAFMDLDSQQLIQAMDGEPYQMARLPLPEVLKLAAEEAGQAGWSQIETPHLFVALATIPFSNTRCALWQQGAVPDLVVEFFRKTLKEAVQGAASSLSPSNLGDRGAEIVRLAEIEANRLGSSGVSDTELLLAILHRGSGQTQTLLKVLGIDPQQMLAFIERSVTPPIP
jgi:serine/threonine protein kinase